MKFLNTRKRKNILKILAQQFGLKNFKFEQALLQDDYDLYLAPKDFEKIEPKKLNIKKIGIHFGKIFYDKILLSIEGTQLISKNVNKNIIQLDEEETNLWIKGQHIHKKAQDIILLKHKQDFLGCAKAQNNKILNSIPKSRRIK